MLIDEKSFVIMNAFEIAPDIEKVCMHLSKIVYVPLHRCLKFCNQYLVGPTGEANVQPLISDSIPGSTLDGRASAKRLDSRSRLCPH